jgi:hypothetical protein
MKPTNYPAALVLFFLPAISVELLTGDTPLDVYLGPITFVILNLTYGGTLVVLRETVMRWGKGFPSILLLAAGYGMVNEAIDTKGFFAPHFYAVAGSGLEGFGRHFGINVPWALYISIFHAIFSIMVPLVLVEAVFRDQKTWIGKKLYVTLIIAVLACSIFSFEVISLGPDFYHYQEGPGPISLILALMATLIFLARVIPPFETHRWQVRINAVVLFLGGGIFTVAFLNFPAFIQRTTGSVVAYISCLSFFFVAIPLGFALKIARPTSLEKLALSAGLLVPLMVFGHEHIGSLFASVVLLLLILIAFIRGRRAAPLSSPPD